MKNSFIAPLMLSVAGLALLLPASYFLLTLFVRVLFGSTTLYYAIAPSFLQASAEIFSFHKSGWILYGPLLVVILNVVAGLHFQLNTGSLKIRFNMLYRNGWLNTAIVLQSLLIFAALVIYLVIQHYRY